MVIPRIAVLIACFAALVGTAAALVSGTSGTVAVETTPHALPADGVIYVFDEQRSVPFVASQPLEFGAIAAGTAVDSHYIQFDPASPTGFVGAGSVTFDGPIIGIATATSSLTADLAPDVASTSDRYFGLEDSIGPYPAGAQPSARGLGSPEDDLIVNLGGNTLDIDSLEIPAGRSGNVDGLRVFTASQSTARRVPIPWASLLALALLFGVPGIRKRKVRA